MFSPKILVIAGSDSSGGAGLEADQRTLAAHGVYAMTATAALTAQNTLGVQDIHVTPPAFLEKQIRAVLEDVDCHAVKIGMLASADTVEVVAKVLQEHGLIGKMVLDPVMVATSGSQLLPVNAVRKLGEQLVKGARLVTPNVPEACLLVRESGLEYDESSLASLDDMKELAKTLLTRLQCEAVLLKGGHVPLKKDYTRATTDSEKLVIADVLYDGKDFNVVQFGYSSNRNTHGTGDSLASAIAANLAKGMNLPQAVKKGCQYVSVGIKTSSNDQWKGPGPINHFHNVQSLPFSKGHFIEYMLDREDAQRVWHDYTHHPFANKMADGTLPIEMFKEYMIQDYLYLTHFARTNALAAYKSTRMAEITTSAQIVSHIEREMSLHLDYCKEFGLTKQEIENHQESQACVAYSRYVLDIGQSQDWLALQMALAPCLLGYGAAATRLYTEKSSKREGNLYWKWIENYVADDYQEAVRKGRALLEENIVKQSPSRIEELIQIFIKATQMEVQFWEFGVHKINKD